MRKTRAASLKEAVGVSLAAALLSCGPDEYVAPGPGPVALATASKVTYSSNGRGVQVANFDAVIAVLRQPGDSATAG